MQIALFLILGLLTGVLSGVFGIGGGILIVPALIFIFQYSLPTASATSLVALLLPVGSFGVWEYYRLGRIDSQNIKMGLIIAVGMLIGTYFGAQFASNLPVSVLRKSFSIFLIFVAMKMWPVF